MLNKTSEYIAMFKKENGDERRIPVNQITFLNEYSEKNILLLYLEISCSNSELGVF